MTDPDGKMSLRQAQYLKAEFMAYARWLAWRASDERSSWGIRYEAAVLGDAALDIAKECDAVARMAADA